MYKAGQGMPSRVGTMIVGVLIALYTSQSWYRWNPLSEFARVDTIIAAVLLLGVCGLFAWLAFRAQKSSNYLIDMDDELRKVVWPSVMPLFDPKTEAWGSTYVVIVCAIFFTLFIFLADVLLKFVVTDFLFNTLLFAK